MPKWVSLFNYNNHVIENIFPRKEYAEMLKLQHLEQMSEVANNKVM